MRHFIQEVLQSLFDLTDYLGVGCSVFNNIFFQKRILHRHYSTHTQKKTIPWDPGDIILLKGNNNNLNTQYTSDTNNNNLNTQTSDINYSSFTSLYFFSICMCVYICVCIHTDKITFLLRTQGCVHHTPSMFLFPQQWC